jgi:hypothetical protein
LDIIRYSRTTSDRPLRLVVAGFAVVLQAVFNGRIARHYRSVMVAVVCSFIGGDVFMGLATVVLFAARPYKAGLLRDGLPQVDILLYLSSFFGALLTHDHTRRFDYCNFVFATMYRVTRVSLEIIRPWHCSLAPRLAHHRSDPCWGRHCVAQQDQFRNFFHLQRHRAVDCLSHPGWVSDLHLTKC